MSVIFQIVGEVAKIGLSQKPNHLSKFHHIKALFTRDILAHNIAIKR